MRWSIIRLIWFRELRDQLRDRRTIFMIAVLPVLLYPLAGFGVMQLARGFFQQKNVVGVAGVENLLPWSPAPPRPTPGFGRRLAGLHPRLRPVFPWPAWPTSGLPSLWCLANLLWIIRR